MANTYHSHLPQHLHPEQPPSWSSPDPLPTGQRWHQRALDIFRVLDIHGSLWGTEYGVEGPLLKNPWLWIHKKNTLYPTCSHLCCLKHGQREAVSLGTDLHWHRRNSLEDREGHISCLYFVQQSRYFVCTYCSEFVSLSHLYLHCLFSEACYYFYWAIFSRTGRARSDSLTWTLLPSSLHKTDWIWMRSLVLMSIIFISQDIFFRTLPAINYVVYLFFSSTML